MTLGGVIAGWMGANVVTRIPHSRLMLVISVLLAAVAVLLIAETRAEKDFLKKTSDCSDSASTMSIPTSSPVSATWFTRP